MMNNIEKRKRIVYCPECQSDMFNLFDLIDHVLDKSCGMTAERLKAVGVIDDGDIEQAKSKMDMAKP